MNDLYIIFCLIAALAILLSITATSVEKFTSAINDSTPDECRNGLYRCVYRQIPFGF